MNPHLQSVADFVKTERMQVILILVFVLASAFLTVYLVVLPQFDIKEENRNLRQALETNRFANQSFANMQAIADHERGNLQSLSNEWKQIAERLASLEIQSTTAIDYKVEHFEISERLQKKCGELNVKFDITRFGIDALLSSDEDIRTRMLQLKAVELLADLTIDRQIKKLIDIYPLAPVQHIDKSGKATFTEYPVRVECDVDFTHLYSFFQSVFEENQVFTFRNIRVASGSVNAPELRVKAILSALRFD